MSVFCRLLARAACFFVFATAMPIATLAWGATGHREINLVAVRALPSPFPAFVRTPQAEAVIEALGTEEDRLKGAGASWDRDFDPGHYVDIGDDGTIAGTVRLDALPGDMAAYAKALGGGGDVYRYGYLPYTIVDGWEQLRKDFAYWRAFDFLATHAADPDAKARFAAERDLREALVIHDVGVWGHFVGDGSQPLHTTIHYDGWGDYPNPSGYTNEHIHSLFEGKFVREHVGVDAVTRLVPADLAPPATHLLAQPEINAMAGSYLAATAAKVPHLYDIAKSNGFRDASPAAVSFATACVADGARELRDLVESAWDNSAYASIGYPEITVRAILDGTVQPGPSAFGGD
jgi:hypothetical protein